jgi:hypothetical protein
MLSRLSWSLLLTVVACGAAVCCWAQDAVVPAGVPLRIQVDHRYPVAIGTKVEGHLIAPVYLVDREVLPVNTKVSGSVISVHPIKGKERAAALLNGDFTPLVRPKLRFDQITLPDGKTVVISTQVTERDGTVVKMKAGRKKSIKQQAEEAVKQQEHDALDQIRKPGKADRLLRIFYSQLPYHPQRIWPGTQFDADLITSLHIPQKTPYTPLPVGPPGEKPLVGMIEARLTRDLSSATAKQGQPVDAVLTRPLLDSTKKQVLLPEGTHLEGVVLQAKPARSFARNGKLRFTFRRVELPHMAAAPAPQPGPELESPQAGAPTATDHVIHGRMISSETDRKQNVQIDSEGGAKATGGADKYVAPLVLGLLAASVAEGDNDNVVKNGVTGNGFGLMARIAGMAAANKQVSMGFACFALAKSVYKRWIARGSDLTFPKDTRIQIELSER